MRAITIKEVTRENWLEALELRVHPEQERFAPPVVYAMARACIQPEGDPVTPYAIYADGQMVGYFNCAYNPDTDDVYWISNFLIDRRYQRRGYGKAALTAIIALIRARFPRCRAINLTVHPENAIARRMYEKLGFADAGWMLSGEHVLHIAFDGLESGD